MKTNLSMRKTNNNPHNLESIVQNLTVERQAYLTALLEVQNAHKSTQARDSQQAYAQTTLGTPTRGPQFRFHKNLATSRYEEFLAESDDEEFFNSQPRTKKGRNFELDFKIDTYRDEIKFNKNGSQKKLIKVQNQVAEKPQNTFHVPVANQQQYTTHAGAAFDPGFQTAGVASDLAAFATHPDLQQPTNFMQAKGNPSVEKYKRVEDLI